MLSRASQKKKKWLGPPRDDEPAERPSTFRSDGDCVLARLTESDEYAVVMFVVVPAHSSEDV